MWHLDPGDVVERSIPRVLVVLAAPLVLQNIIHVANIIVDTFWLGRLGENEVAAVGLNFPVLSVVAAGITLVAIGTQLTLAERVGAGKHVSARRLAVTGILTAAFIGIVISTAVFFGADWMMFTLAGDPVLGGLAALYLSTIILFYPIAFVSDTIENAFIGWGDTRAALHINLVIVGTNIVLDPFLIFGIGPFPTMGVQGAAIASGIGFSLGLVLALSYALGLRSSFRITRTSFAYSTDLAREILSIGWPLSGQRVVGEVVRVAILGFVAMAGGAAGVAAYTVGERVATLVIVPALGLQQAAQTMVSQNIGADRPRRARRVTTVGIALATGVLLAFGIIQWVFAGLIVDILVPDLSETGRDLSILFLQILALSYWALGATYLILAGFNGIRRTRTSFVIDLLKYWGIRFPIAILAIPTTVTFTVLGISISPGIDLGVEAIFWAVTISNVMAAIGAGAYLLVTTRQGMFQRAANRSANNIGGD